MKKYLETLPWQIQAVIEAAYNSNSGLSMHSNLHSALATLAAAPEPPTQDGWLPIETAPRDGTMILAGTVGKDDQWLFRPTGVYFKNDEWYLAYGDVYTARLSHWRELPPPPERKP